VSNGETALIILAIWLADIPFHRIDAPPLPALCPLITFSNHLEYLTRQGFTELNVMNLIMYPLQFLARTQPLIAILWSMTVGSQHWWPQGNTKAFNSTVTV